MHFSKFLLPLLPISLALPLSPRDQDLAPQLLETINNLNTAVNGLTTAVNDFDGSLFTLIPQSLAVLGASTKVDATVLKATKIASESSNFTADESTEVIQTLATQITPIQASLDALKAKYPVFKKVFQAPIVLLNLKVLKEHTGSFILAVKDKVAPDQAGLLDFGLTLLNQAFDDAIAVYQG